MIRRAVCLALCAATALAGCSRKQEGAASADQPAAQASASAVVAPATPPKRKPGLWVQTMTIPGMTQKSSICTDAAVEDAVGFWGQQMTRDRCARSSITRNADGSWTVESQCDMGSGGVTTTKGVARGDFNTAYSMTMESSTVGAGAAHMNGVHKMTLQATWQGPCPAGAKPGDIDLGNGMKINMMDMAAASGGGAKK